MTFDFQVPAAVPGKTARGVARLQGDNLPMDDQFFFSVPIHQSPRVAVFEGIVGRAGAGAQRLLPAPGAGGGDPATASEPPALAAAALEDDRPRTRTPPCSWRTCRA